MTDSCSWLTLQPGKDDMEGHKGVKQFSWPWHICKFVHTGPCLGDHLVVPEKTISSSECWASRQTDSLLLSQSESRSASPQGGEASTHLVANHSLTWLSTILSRAANRTPPCLLMQATALQLLVQTNTCFPCVKEYEVLEDKNTAFIPRKFMCRTSVGGHTSSTTLSRQVPPQPVRDAVMNTIKWQVTRHSIAVDDLDDLHTGGSYNICCRDPQYPGRPVLSSVCREWGWQTQSVFCERSWISAGTKSISFWEDRFTSLNGGGWRQNRRE